MSEDVFTDMLEDDSEQEEFEQAMLSTPIKDPDELAKALAEWGDHYRGQPVCLTLFRAATRIRDLELKLSDARAQLAIADEQIRLEKGATDEAQNRCLDLQAWKESMLRVEASCDMQQVARLLGLPLGADIRPSLIPAIERLKSQLNALAKALQAYRLPYTDAELKQLAASQTGRGEISPEVAQREIDSRAALAAIEGGAS